MSLQHLAFDFRRAVQAVAFLLRHTPGSRMNYMRLLKLLYVAERESLGESGQGIVGGRAIAMERGPVLEDVYSLIRGQHLHSPDWHKNFHCESYHIVMHEDPGIGQLTPFITSKLSQVTDRHKDDDEWDMIAFTHKNIPEWQKNDPGDSSRVIPLCDILEAVGASGELDRIIDHDSQKAAIASDLQAK